MAELHRCDERCVCPTDGKPLYYHAPSREHACMDPNCLNAHGMQLADLIQERVTRAFALNAEIWDPPATPMEDLLAAIRAVQQSDYARLERTCEEAIQGGEHGVVVSHRNGRLVFCEVSRYVPYGQIYSIDARVLEPPVSGFKFNFGFHDDEPDKTTDEWRSLWEGKWLDWQDDGRE